MLTHGKKPECEGLILFKNSWNDTLVTSWKDDYC